MFVTVFGATGNTGRAVISHLLHAGATVRAVTRDRTQAADLGAREIMEWEWQQPEAFDKALDGADAAYFMCPVGLYEGSLFAFRDEYSRRFAAAAKAAAASAKSRPAAKAAASAKSRPAAKAAAAAASAKSRPAAKAAASAASNTAEKTAASAASNAPDVGTASTGILRRVVQLSSFGADIATNSGVLEGLHKAEQNLAGCAPERIILRPGYFWQNFRANVAAVRDRNFLGGYPIEPETQLLFSDTTEIGRIAAQLLLDHDPRGDELYYTGDPTLYRFSDIAAALGHYLGKGDLTWTNVGYDAAREYMVAQSMPADLVDNFIAFFSCINSGRTMKAYSPDRLIQQNFGLEEFVRWFADQMVDADPDSPAASSS